MAALALAYARARRRAGLVDDAPLVPRSAALAMGLLALWVPLASLTHADPAATLAEARGLACMLALFAATALSPLARRAAGAAIAVVAVVVAAAVCLERAGVYLPGLGHAVDAALVRPAAMMPHRNVAAVTLIAAVPLLLALLAGARAAWQRAAAVAALGLVGAALVAAASRVSIAAALVGVAVAWVGAPRLRALLPPRRLALAAALVVGALLLPRALAHGAMPAPQTPTRTSPTPTLADKLAVSFGGHDFSRDERTQLWRMAVDSVAHHPLFGVGPEAFRARWRAVHPWQPLPGAHDATLQMAVSHGLPAALFFAFVAIVVIRAALSLRAREGEEARRGGARRRPRGAARGVAASRTSPTCSARTCSSPRSPAPCWRSGVNGPFTASHGG